ncbi:plasmid mobilization protein [Streptomyces albipurpureus]|uniref:MobC family plasmid mobilization relaxosome protein n=1 Tax=Streptomyces albipurpureus TaxID=2897419 RepID=A0ABT0UUH2_9ACTN|nr:plasmid mobilization relaxosome protein MobC [Streptomyces sp. CWNU-1]MCM2392042.1 MobC family plasmid mobilization relaxosome protein [Streptomyces sp. CWNU-1]
MTHPNTTDTTDEGSVDCNSTSARASWCESIAPGGSNALASPAPGVTEVDRHQGAPVHRDGAEGGSHPEEGNQHCHSEQCAHAVVSKPAVQQRERLRDEHKRVRQPSCRMNDDEYQLLVRAAAACRMSVASFLAHTSLKAARDLDRTAAQIADERSMVNELFALRRHLGQIGNNLNQIAKATNSGADVPHTGAVLNAVHRAASRVDQFTQRYLDQATAAE